MKPGNPPLQSIRLLDQLRERSQYMHYSLATKKVYLEWLLSFIRWSARNGQMRHRREMGARSAATRQSIDGMDRHGLQPRDDEMSGLAMTHGASS
jgi:hypothetical protein